MFGLFKRKTKLQSAIVKALHAEIHGLPAELTDTKKAMLQSLKTQQGIEDVARVLQIEIDNEGTDNVFKPTVGGGESFTDIAGPLARLGQALDGERRQLGPDHSSGQAAPASKPGTGGQ